MCTFGDGIKAHLLILKFVFLPITHAARDRVPKEKRDWQIPSRNLRARTGFGNPTLDCTHVTCVPMRMPNAIKDNRDFKRYL